MAGTKIPIQQQTSPLPGSIIGPIWDKFETAQWNHEFDAWWDKNGAKYKKHTLTGGTAKEMAEQEDKVAGMRKLLLMVWLDSRATYLKSIETGQVKFS